MPGSSSSCERIDTLVDGCTLDDFKAASIGRLPPELLCHIFELASPAQTDTTAAVPVVGARSWDKTLILGFPWVFGQVCSEWRALAISLPTLWTSITVSTTLLPRELPLLQTQLSRSGTAPLNVLVRFAVHRHRHFEFPPDFFNSFRIIPTEEEPWHIFLSTLATHSVRWRTLHLQFEGVEHDEAALPGLDPHALPRLEALTFGGYSLSPIASFDLFGEAPALRRVLLGAMGGFADPPLRLPWHQLTTYKAMCKDAATHLRNLAAAPALVECDIGLRIPWRATAPDINHQGAAVVLPRVRRLALTHPAFLNCIAAPALQSLYIVGPVANVLPFLQRSGCTTQLAELTVARCTAPVPEIVALLQQTTALTALSLDLRPGTPPAELVAALTGNGLCPKLTSLSWADFEDAVDRDAFAEMVASRCHESPSVYGLNFVALYSGRRRMKSAGWRIRALSGLEVRMLNAKKGRPAVEKWRGYIG